MQVRLVIRTIYLCSTRHSCTSLLRHRNDFSCRGLFLVVHVLSSPFISSLSIWFIWNSTNLHENARIWNATSTSVPVNNKPKKINSDGAACPVSFYFDPLTLNDRLLFDSVFIRKAAEKRFLTSYLDTRSKGYLVKEYRSSDQMFWRDIPWLRRAQSSRSIRRRVFWTETISLRFALMTSDSWGSVWSEEAESVSSKPSILVYFLLGDQWSRSVTMSCNVEEILA
jgi:hypothetical protein